ncbi:MAG: dihydroorotate dehydrogenase electron transfer subunit [Methanobrevibacter sp.]|jgi:dihydroorotate dehydrogenase electron transfer subunit|nr:dihydroorotate dehydrogenase electron transfer subunit [Candidatus Methanovirga australis]
MDKLDNGYRVLKIKEIIEETPTIKTFIFDWDMKEGKIPVPGQFIMIWSFNGVLDEKPMSISKIDTVKGEIAVTVKQLGEFTKHLHSLVVGDELGIRGPYGNGFKVHGENILVIGGGVGMAPVKCFGEYAKSLGKNVDFIIASITKDELLFFDELCSSFDVYSSTDDGTCGFKGFASHRLIDLLKSSSYDMAVVCGPEIMMKGIYDILEESGIPGQYSMERYMKCGIGICGQCCTDDTGWRVCVEGPVFSSTYIKEISEFGKYHRDSAGVKH